MLAGTDKNSWVTGDHYFTTEPAAAARPRGRVHGRRARLHPRRGRRGVLGRPARSRHRGAAAQGRPARPARPVRCWTSAAATARSPACWPPSRRRPRSRRSTSTSGPCELTAANAAASASPSGSRVAARTTCPPTSSFAQIWSNPPIRIGKAELHALLLRWLPRLTPDGMAWLVVGPPPRRRLAAALAGRAGLAASSGTPARRASGSSGHSR